MPETSAGAAAARQKLGQILKESRRKKRITVEQAADHIERTRPTVWKLETGAPGVRIRPRGDIAKLCDLYDVDDETRTALLALTEATKIKGCYQPYSDIIPPGFDVYLGLEEIASEISTYESEVLPGLLQTEEYARAIIRIPNGGSPPDERDVERRINLRLRRQELLTRHDAPDVEFIVNELTLRRTLTDNTAMIAQLARINEVGWLPNVSIRVLPFNSGPHYGLVSGSFVMLRFLDQKPFIYAEGFMGSLWFREPTEVARYKSALRELRQIALDERRSRDVIACIAKEMSK